MASSKMNFNLSELSTSPERRLQVPGMFALSPTNRKAAAGFSIASPTASPHKIPDKSLSASPSPPPLMANSSLLDSSLSSGTPTPTKQRKGTVMSDGSDMSDLKLKHLVHRRLPAIKLEESELSLKDFSLGVTLGTGTFGRVNLVRHKTSKQPYFALKTMKKCDIVRLKQVDHIISEAALLKDLAHPFIVNMCGAFQDSKRLYLVLEYVPGGELFTYLRRERKIPDDYARFYTSEIVLALDYLHSRGIAYRDLKPENLLLSRTGHLKITDFGFAKKVDGRTWTLCGTPEYLAPEIIQSKGHGKGVDWWALGILIYEMLAGYPPFYDESPLAIYQKILRGVVEWPSYFDSRVQVLISKLLKADLSQRLGCLRNGAEDVANEMWFAKVNWQSVLDRLVSAPFFPPIAHPGDTSNFDEYAEEDETSRVGSVKPEDEAKFALFGPYREDKDRLDFVQSKIENEEPIQSSLSASTTPTNGSSKATSPSSSMFRPQDI